MTTLSNIEKDSWQTDIRVFNKLNAEFNFGLDAAASDDNTLCDLYLTKERDALKCNWSKYTKTVWCNPPYSRGHIGKFVKKAIEQKELGVTTVLLVPNTVEASWVNIDSINELRLIINGRINFYHPITKKIVTGNPKGSMFIITRPNNSPVNFTFVNKEDLLN